MQSSLCLTSNLLRGSGRRTLPSISTHHYHHHHQQQQQQIIRYKHQVRVIVTKDLPDGQMRGVYAGEVHNVAAGYARNYLIPGKMAAYATPRNFERSGIIDPEILAKEELASSVIDDDEDNEDLKAADLLRRYLRNKTVKMIRNVDPNQPMMCHPGHVTAKNLREKLSKQLKIDLEDYETIHIRNEPIVGLETKEEGEIMQFLREMGEENIVVLANTENSSDGEETEDNKAEADMGDEEVEVVADEEEDPAAAKMDAAADDNEVDGNITKDCDTKVKQLGDYLAKITLGGGYVVPLKFSVQRR